MDNLTLIVILTALAVLVVSGVATREHWTLYLNFLAPTMNRLAPVIRTELVQGDVTDSTAQLAYRAGRSDGRRGVRATSSEATVVAAVEASGSLIAEEYVAKVNAIKKQAEGLRAEAATARATADRAATRPPIEVPTVPEEQTDAPPDLNVSITRRRAAAAVAAQTAATNQILSLHASAEQNEAQATAIEQAIADLDTDYGQKWESAQRLGEFIWNRYVNGYHYGARADDSTLNGVTADISFSSPTPWKDELNA